MENFPTFSDEQIKKVHKTALAEKYNCSPAYIGQVLRGEKGKGKTAGLIRKDANELLKILGDPIMNIEVVDPQFITA